MSRNSLFAVAVSALVILAFAVTGYLLGQAQAPTAGEWQVERSQSQAKARKKAMAKAFVSSRHQGRREGMASGGKRGSRLGYANGARAGGQAVDAAFAAIEEEEQEELAELEYDPQLPNGDPGYLLPEGERSVACIGISAETGECVGD